MEGRLYPVSSETNCTFSPSIKHRWRIASFVSSDGWRGWFGALFLCFCSAFFLGGAFRCFNIDTDLPNSLDTPAIAWLLWRNGIYHTMPTLFLVVLLNTFRAPFQSPSKSSFLSAPPIVSLITSRSSVQATLLFTRRCPSRGSGLQQIHTAA